MSYPVHYSGPETEKYISKTKNRETESLTGSVSVSKNLSDFSLGGNVLRLFQFFQFLFPQKFGEWFYM